MITITLIDVCDMFEDVLGLDRSAADHQPMGPAALRQLDGIFPLLKRVHVRSTYSGHQIRSGYISSSSSWPLPDLAASCPLPTAPCPPA